MAKKSRTKARSVDPVEGEVGPRQPCPCGSGKRYKACHGAADGGASAFVARPFACLAGECDIVALRELVPAATAPLTLTGEHVDYDTGAIFWGAGVALLLAGVPDPLRARVVALLDRMAADGWRPGQPLPAAPPAA